MTKMRMSKKKSLNKIQMEKLQLLFKELAIQDFKTIQSLEF